MSILFGPTFSEDDERGEWSQPESTSACVLAYGPSNYGGSCWINATTSMLFYPDYVRHVLFSPVIREYEKNKDDASLRRIVRHIVNMTTIFTGSKRILDECPKASPSLLFYNAMLTYLDEKDGTHTPKVAEKEGGYADIGAEKIISSLLRVGVHKTEDLSFVYTQAVDADAEFITATVTTASKHTISSTTQRIPLQTYAFQFKGDVVIFCYEKDVQFPKLES